MKEKRRLLSVGLFVHKLKDFLQKFGPKMTIPLKIFQKSN